MIESNKRNTKPTILVKPEQGETMRYIRMKLTNLVKREDRITFQMIQAKTALILQMASNEDEKILKKPSRSEGGLATNGQKQ